MKPQADTSHGFCFDNTELLIVSRLELEELAQNNRAFLEPAYVISITDSDASLVQINATPKGLLRLSFDDVIDIDELKDALNPEEASFIDDYILINQKITMEQALKIVNFVQDNKDNMTRLICQCEMGQSRSAAIAAAIMEHYEGSSETILNDPRYSPNKIVYETILDAFNK